MSAPYYYAVSPALWWAWLAVVVTVLVTTLWIIISTRLRRRR